jgi:MOSC domain-containing protein YiiM
VLPKISIPHLLIGRAKPFGPNGEPSAINKHCVAYAARLTRMGLADDEHGDPRHHGGPDKALHHYPGEHYAAWRSELADVPAERWRIGGFGENLGPLGLTENEVCLGDLFRLGSALIQVSQPRQPCWKLNRRFGCPDMAARVQASGRTGWYYRVIEAGEVAPGAELILVDRPHADWPLARLLHYFYRDPLDRDALAAIAALAALTPSWRQQAAQRLASGRVEDWARRLETPSQRPQQ